MWFTTSTSDASEKYAVSLSPTERKSAKSGPAPRTTTIIQGKFLPEELMSVSRTFNVSLSNAALLKDRQGREHALAIWSGTWRPEY
jgi:hypothetical protein